jgi:putative addiction module CopG family antidote
MAKLVRRKVASGQYATESEVVREGLRALAARDRAMEVWLRNEAVPALEAMKKDRSRGVSAANLRAALKQTHKKAAKTRR